MKRRNRTIFLWFFVWLAMATLAGGLILFYFQLSWPILFLIAVNFATFFLFGWDKIAAAQKIDRVPELILYTTIVFGGGAGALLGMNFFRHKTRKSSFQLIVFLILIVQIATLAWLFQNEFIILN
jgi:uncharacterized membrane protein YsdA (DUF1294 family)